jgi:tetratricopeptide (TPR) repeat protein
MPRLQDIERFKRDLSALSHEAEVLERWGEKPEKITPPEGAAVAQAPGEAAPASPEAPGAAAPKRSAPPPKPAALEESEGAPPDFAALLDGLPLEGEGEEPAPSSLDEDLEALLGPSSTEEEEAESPLSEPSPMPDLGEMPDLESIPEPEEAEAAEPATLAPDEASAEARAEGPSEAESFDFSMPEFGEEPSDKPTEKPESLEPGEAEGAPSDEALPAEESFSIPDFNLAEEESAAQETPAAPAGEGGEDFSIPDLEAGFESPAAPAAAAPESSDLGDAFESFSFEEPGAASALGSSGSLGPGPGRGSAPDLDTEIASLSEEASVADTFKLDQDWGDFGSFGGAEGKESVPRPAPSRPNKAAPRETEEKFKPVSLTEGQVDRLQDSLLAFPLNLRVAVEDILANGKGSEAQQSKLVWAMVDGLPADQVATVAGRIIKRQIPIPKGYEKRSGEALEAEKGTLAYAFVHTFLPVIKIGLLVLAAAGAIGYLGWRYVYVPLSADSLYRSGYQRIAEDRYLEAEADFAKATSMREFIDWYYRYADAYAGKRQYILAERKYAALVEAHPKETKGILAWARLEKEQLKYEEAVDVLKGAPKKVKGEDARGKTGLLSWDYFNSDGLLLLGDIYLDWGEEDPAKYEAARKTYATLLEHYGDEDVYLERMLLYFIRVDKEKEVLPLKAHFLADPKKQALSAPVLAELGGYLLDKGLLDDVRDILVSAAKKDPSVPEAHYHLARYYQRILAPDKERKALDAAIAGFAALPGLGGRKAGMYIDSLIWRGRFLVEAKEWVGAERDFADAASEYEKALELRRVQKSGRFGEAYAGLGDVAFWQRDDLASALAYYERAEANGYSTPSTNYRRGDILYRTGRYAESLERFYEAAQDPAAASPYLDYAFGSALYARSDYFAAEAYFRKTAAAMEKSLAEVGEPMPQESPSQAEILGLYLRAENNLGVALYRSAARSGDARRRNEAMAALTRATRLYDQLSQAPSLLEGPEGRDLPLANMNALLGGGRGEGLQVYSAIEKDMRFPRK